MSRPAPLLRALALAQPRRSSLPLFLAAAVATLLLACGGSDDDGASATPTTVAAAQPGTCGPAGSGIAAIPRDQQRRFSSPPERVIDPTRKYTVTMETQRGTIVLELDAANAPNTTNNFVFLACHGFYDGLTFHRVEKTPVPFVIQGGDPEGTGRGGPGYEFPNEISPNLNHNSPGVISMANRGPDTNGSQFFILLGPAPHLNGSYNAFGKVTSGMDVVNSIRAGDMILSVSVTES